MGVKREPEVESILLRRSVLGDGLVPSETA
uniref:Transcriptional regulator n=1 Tax=Bursaphelenchus xylophilus TaxID=6326 RepID=A0A1I7SPL2_BURXY